ncbi:MAG: hypothetical protein EKK64_05870 [Neisseriaceae bacterium]|nr:MAG: hypothetical protein EKK64_05870 [Neisseriaceae bacterium]
MIQELNLFDKEYEVIQQRNKIWSGNSLIPKWVNLEDVGLDQYFTNDDVAKYCYESLNNHLLKNNVKPEDFTFIEPSAGRGSFFDLLPKTNRIGLDIFPLHPDIIKQDFLSWNPPHQNNKYIFIGNPPFGYRAWLALSFMNHAAQFAEYIGFILPMSFQSDGKGNPKNRIKGMELIHSENISSDSFHLPNNQKCKVNAVWQIWKKGSPQQTNKKTCKLWLDLFTVDMRKERLCGQEKFHSADFFLQRTYYNKPPTLVKTFDEVKYVCGYGLIIKKDKDRIINILDNTDWNNYSNLATHNCRHISMYHIEKALIDRGVYDV